MRILENVKYSRVDCFSCVCSKPAQGMALLVAVTALAIGVLALYGLTTHHAGILTTLGHSIGHTGSLACLGSGAGIILLIALKVWFEKRGKTERAPSDDGSRDAVYGNLDSPDSEPPTSIEET